MSTRQLCNYIYSWALQHIEPEDREGWTISLYEPIRNMGRAAQAKAEEMVAEMEMRIFDREVGNYR